MFMSMTPATARAELDALPVRKSPTNSAESTIANRMFIIGPAMATRACAVRIEILRVDRARRERDLHRLAPAEDARADGGAGEDGDERQQQGADGIDVR